jgi:hypothetical protein
MFRCGRTPRCLTPTCLTSPAPRTSTRAMQRTQPSSARRWRAAPVKAIGRCSILANEAASSPRNAAAAAAACAAGASSAGSAAAYGAASTASAGSAASCSRAPSSRAPSYRAPSYPRSATRRSATPPSATPLGILHAGQISFSVENKERSQADVKDFLFIENQLRWGIPQINIRFGSNDSCRGCTGHRHGHADDSRNRYGLLQVLQVLLLCPWHSRSSMPAGGKCDKRPLAHTQSLAMIRLAFTPTRCRQFTNAFLRN